MRHFRQTHASYQCAKRKQKRMSVDIAILVQDLRVGKDQSSICQVSFSLLV